MNYFHFTWSAGICTKGTPLYPELFFFNYLSHTHIHTPGEAGTGLFNSLW